MPRLVRLQREFYQRLYIPVPLLVMAYLSHNPGIYLSTSGYLFGAGIVLLCDSLFFRRKYLLRHEITTSELVLHFKSDFGLKSLITLDFDKITKMGLKPRNLNDWKFGRLYIKHLDNDGLSERIDLRTNNFYQVAEIVHSWQNRTMSNETNDLSSNNTQTG